MIHCREENVFLLVDKELYSLKLQGEGLQSGSYNSLVPQSVTAFQWVGCKKTHMCIADLSCSHVSLVFSVIWRILALNLGKGQLLQLVCRLD